VSRTSPPGKQAAAHARREAFDRALAPYYPETRSPAPLICPRGSECRVLYPYEQFIGTIVAIPSLRPKSLRPGRDAVKQSEIFRENAENSAYLAESASGEPAYQRYKRMEAAGGL
jgi:hypothetical protein